MYRKTVKKHILVGGMTILCIVLFGSCSARKNTAPSRFFHALNSRYNTYFNGKTTFDEALRAMNEGYKESFTEQIHMYPINSMYNADKTTTGGAFDRAIEKGNKAIKLHSITEKPPRKEGWQKDPKQVKLQAVEEYNPFIKHCWMLIAESHFYNCDFLTAAVTYSYISRHYATDPVLVAEARIRQARCYTQMDWFYETNNILKKLSETGIPPQLQKNYDRMFAEYLIKSDQTEKAIPYLQSAIPSEKNKRLRSRMRYLLGQLYLNNNQNELAYQTFGKVASSNPPYEIEFASRIRQTEVFPGNNYEKVLKMLRRMSKSDKNKDFLDQVFYAMGNVYLTQQDTVKAIDSYAQGIEKSTQNGVDKAICQIRLGDIYFTQKDYIKAQPCFSGAMSGITKEYKDYNRISRLSETLDALVVHYEAVHLQDSLQVLAAMPEAQRLAVIDKIIAQIIEEEKKAKEEADKEAFLAQQAARGTGLNQRNNIPTPATPAGPGANAFYFYNPQVVSQGKTQFENKWGKRKLEDNWRRTNKQVALLPTGDENQATVGTPADDLTTPSDSIQTAQATQTESAQDPKTREYYLQQIPFTEDEVVASNTIIMDGMFNMGMIYKDKLEDKDLSVEVFEDLQRRFPDNTYRLEYYYQIYLMALRFKDTDLAEKYKALLLADFPDDDYSIAVSDPDYEYNMRMMNSVQDSIYETTYDSYLAGDTVTVRSNYQVVSAKYPLAKLLPKFMFLNALTYVQAGDPDGFKKELTLLTDKFPSADVSELASEMLKGLLRGRQLMQGSFSSMTWDFRFGTDENGQFIADSTLTFSTEQAAPHRMLLIYSTGSLDRNQLLFAVAAYNFANFRVKGFDLDFEDVGALTILTINGFNNLTEILDYYRLIYGENGYAPVFDDVVAFFPFSNENYNILMRGKTLDEYMHFFVENFSDMAPGLVKRWNIRVESDRKALEDEQAATHTTDAASKTIVSDLQTTSGKTTSGLTQKSDTTDIEQIINAAIQKIAAKDSIPPATTVAKEAGEKEVGAGSQHEEARPDAKRSGIFQNLFKRLKETKEFKSIEESIQTIKDLTEAEAPADSIPVEKPFERVEGELTFDQIQQIRQREAEEKAILDAEATLSKEDAQKAVEAQKKQQAKEREQQRIEKEKAQKDRLKQQAKDRKQREKDLKAAQKAKDKDRKATQAQKDKARQTAQKSKPPAKK